MHADQEEFQIEKGGRQLERANAEILNLLKNIWNVWNIRLWMTREIELKTGIRIGIKRQRERQRERDREKKGHQITKLCLQVLKSQWNEMAQQN